MSHQTNVDANAKDIFGRTRSLAWVKLGVRSASLLLVASCGYSPADDPGGGSQQASVKFLAEGLVVQEAPRAVPRANCGPGSSPETGLQGQVPLEDRINGRSQLGYQCNLERIGQYQGEGATWVNPFYRNCAYMGTSFGGIATKKSQGVQVVDLTDPRRPMFSTNLTSPAMFQGPWESLKTNERRGLLGAVAVGPLAEAAFFDVYDLTENCAKPVLRNTYERLRLPANVLGHEGNWAPDGRTYWATGLVAGSLTAIDVSDPRAPKIVYTGTSVVTNHGFSLSEDGNRMYLTTGLPAGLLILDVSDIQKRSALPTIRQVSSIFWSPNGISQHSIPVTWGGKQHLIIADELAAESVRIVDISDERNPKIVNHLKLEIQLPENAAAGALDTAGNGTIFGYDAHYCTVDRRNDPTALACGFFNSGIRVFDVSNPLQVKEIAYYNPPAQVGKNADLQGAEHVAGLVTGNNVSNLTADWCSSPPRFVGRDQLWVTCQDNGVQVLKFTNGVYKRNTNSDDPRLETRTMDD